MLGKILKWITGSKAKSYEIKFALTDTRLGSLNHISESEVGAALQEVIHSRLIRGKFNSVHPDLRAEGVTRVEVSSHGITFHRDGKFKLVSKQIVIMLMKVGHVTTIKTGNKLEPDAW